MTNKSIATALTLGFLAFTLSTLPVTTAEAGCTQHLADCPKGSQETARTHLPVGDILTCCSTPSEPYATGETESERQQREAKECAAMGPSYRYDPQKTPRCSKPIKVIGKSKADACALKGANYRYDPQYGCIKTISKKAPVTSGGAGGGE